MNKLTPGSNLMWESMRMMLPEHKAALNEYQRQKKEYRPPELDQDALEEINRTIRTAIHEGKEVSITYARKYGPDQIIGHIKKIDPHNRQVIIKTREHVLTLAFGDILAADLG